MLDRPGSARFGPPRLLVALLVGAGVSAVTLIAEQRDSSNDLSDRVARWYAAVDDHMPGVRDPATIAVANWPRADLVSVLAELKKTADIPSRNRRLKRAAMLHADVAILNRDSRGYSLPPSDRESAWYMDGQLVSVRGGTVHWEFGRLLLDALQPSPSRDEFVRLWYRATGAFLQASSEHVELRPHLSRALQIFPDDAVLLLYGGTMHAALAEPRVQSAMQIRQTDPSDAPFVVTRTTPVTVQPSATTGNATNERRNAEALFRRALRLDPSLSEAHIRLAYILGLRGRHREAIDEANRALEARLTPRMRYYALLFLGRAQHALGRYAEATSSFERAALLFPGAQSARLGLSQAARAEGHRDEAVAHLEPLARLANRTSREDPWREYALAHVPAVTELVAELRRSTAR